MEELKLILDMITLLSGEGKEIFLWWLFVDKGLHALVTSSFVWLLYRVVYYTFKTWATTQQNDLLTHTNSQRLQEIRNLILPHESGYVSDREYLNITLWIKQKNDSP